MTPKGKLPRPRTPAGAVTHTVLLGVWRVIATIVLVGIMTGCIVAAILTVYVLKYVQNDYTEIDLNNLKLSGTTILYATNDAGEDYELQRIFGDKNRIWIDADQMPDHLFDVTIAAEDKRFMSHHGVDWLRTIKSFLMMFVPGSTTQGGSTLTQQVVKNVTGEAQVRVDRKIKEIFSALNLERKFSKTQILEAYLNIAPFGGRIEGIQAAANYYFNKDAKDLTVPECAAIIATTQAPTGNSPILNPENNKARRNYIYETMLEMGTITQEEYEEYKNTEIVIDLNETSANKTNAYQSWFVDYVMDSVIADLMEEYGYTEAQATSHFLNDGYRVYTTVDEDMQEYLEQQIINPDVLPPVYNETYPEAAFVIMDHNGKVLALAGSDRPKEGNRLFNRATDALRQPGSTFKPISAYLQGFETNTVTWSTVIEDAPIMVMNGGEEMVWPRNETGTYRGNITVLEAIQRSINTIPSKITTVVGPQKNYDTLKNRLGVESLVESDIAPSPMALGALTYGLRLIELVGAYQVYANGGMFTEPYCYTRVLDSNGNIILENNTTPVRVVSQDTAYIINQLLQKCVNQSPGTGVPAKIPGMTMAGKTGTTNDDNDVLFVGLTPYYVAGCWMGYDEKEAIQYWGLGHPPPKLWKNIMEPLHEGLEDKPFFDSPGVVELAYCTRTGMLASANCATTAIGYYKTDFKPQECNICGSTVSSSPGDGEDDGLLDSSGAAPPDEEEPTENEEAPVQQSSGFNIVGGHGTTWDQLHGTVNPLANQTDENEQGEDAGDEGGSSSSSSSGGGDEDVDENGYLHSSGWRPD